MKLFLSIIKIELLTYRRNKLYYFAGIMLTMYLLLGWYHFLREEYIEAGVMLQSTSYINMSASLLGLFSGIMAGRRERATHFQEVLSSIPGDNIRPASKFCAWFIVSAVFTLLGYLEVLIFFNIPGSEYLLFKTEILTYIIIYWGLPLLSSGIFGYFFETVISSNHMLTLVTLFLWFIISPFNGILHFVLPEKILLLLNIGENDVSAAYDNEYSGLHISGHFIKNAAMYFALSLLLSMGGILFKKRNEMRRPHKYVLAFAILIIASSVYLLFNSITWTENMKEDINYYLEHVNNKPTGRFENEELIMKSCDIKLFLEENVISYTVQEDISNIFSNTIPFTLYHGLEVVSVKVGNQEADFKREGDRLYLMLPEEVKQISITFEVRGNTGDYCSVKDNSVFLSSTFPWYPVPGELIIAEKGFPYGEIEFKNTELKEQAEFRVHIEGTGQFFSNLEKISENEFYGFQKGVCLFKGMLILKKINGKEYLVPPDRIDTLVSQISKIEEKIKYVSDIIGRPPKKIPDKIFVKPVYSFSAQNNFILAEDYMAVSSHLNKYSRLSDIKGVFRGFYWNDIYREVDNSHAYIFEIVLEYMEGPEKSDNYINIFNEDNSGDFIFLKKLSSEVIELYKSNPNYLKRLLETMYGEIENNPETPLDYWLYKIDEIKQKG